MFLLISMLQLPLSIVALSGALLLFVGALRWKQTTARDVGKQVSWSICSCFLLDADALLEYALCVIP